MSLLTTTLCAGVFAATLVIALTGPPRYILPAFAAGFVAYGVRAVVLATGVGINWATVPAAAAAVLVAAIVTRRHRAEPVVVISAILPLSAAVSVFAAILDLVRASQATGEALQQLSTSLTADIGAAFTTTAALVLGLQIGFSIVRFARTSRLV